VPRLRRFDTVDEELVIGGRRLRLVRPRSADDLLDEAVAADVPEAPYWAWLWPSARVLAEALLARDLAGLRAVELGCGLGLGAVAAALAGADVVATDHDADALAFARENGRRALGHRLPTLLADFADLPDELLGEAPFDLVIAADVLYAAGVAGPFAGALRRLVRPGGEALVAYPWTGQADDVVAALGWPAQHREDAGARLVRLLRPR
jgi:predicted nicotinamide N-methyase